MTGPVSVSDIMNEIRRRENPSSSIIFNLALLAVTLFLFYQAQVLSMSVSGVAMLLAVLVIHEAGHFAAMKLFGYRDVKMFFIPFLGAAVSGKEKSPAAWKRAVVSLMGPLPGLLLGLVALGVYNATGNPFFRGYGYLSLALNGFNLLPVYPLDGGKFFETVLFSRNAYLEIAFKVTGVILLILSGLLLKSTALALFGVLLSLSIRQTFSVAAISAQLKKENVASEGGSEVPEDFAETVLPYIEKREKNGTVSPARAADMIMTLWARMRMRQPGVLASVGWIALYAAVILVVLVSASVIRLYSPVPEGEWKPYTSQEGRFSVAMPGIPREKELPGGVHGKAVFVQTQSALYSVTWSDVKDTEAGRFLSEEPVTMASAMKGSLAAQRDIALGSAQGKEFTIAHPSGSVEGRCRIFLDGTRCYKVFVFAEKGAGEKESKIFFESFSLKR